jgi:hypothetical protein
MGTNVANIFTFCDIVGQPMLAHKAVHEALAARAWRRTQRAPSRFQTGTRRLKQQLTSRSISASVGE